jgi:hypothetical protein
MQLFSIVGSVFIFFFFEVIKFLYTTFSTNFFTMICVIVTHTPCVADDNAGLKNILDAISEDEGSARSPVVPTSPYSGDVNLSPLL